MTSSRSPLSVLAALSASLVLLLTTSPSAAVVTDTEPEQLTTGRYAVLFEEAPLAAYGGGIAGLAATDPEVTGEGRLDPDDAASRAYLTFLAAQRAARLRAIEAALGRQVEPVYTYEVTLNGVALELSEAEADRVAGIEGVARVAPDQTRYLQTDHGPEWIGASAIWDASGGTKGEGVVVGVIDSGVNFDHPSFATTGGDGYTHANPRGTYYGLCDPVTGAPFCTQKLIGVWDFTGTGPQDTNGHGSHTASTSAGNVLSAKLVAPTVTVVRDISGVAPHASLITYKVCPDLSCSLVSILAAIDQATADMVDVINYSIGGDANDPWVDLDAQAYLNATRAGVLVATSAGNSGPGAESIGSPADAPWVLTVGASTHDRKFVNALIGMSGGGSAPPPDLFGKSVTSAYGPATIAYAGDYGDALCAAPFAPGTFDGEIVVCDRGTSARVEKARNASIGGAGGFVLANEAASGDSTVADPYAIPGVNIGHDDGVALKAWLASGSGHTGSIQGTALDDDPAHGDVMASFSSRGPNPSVPDVLKPDVTAPGVDILAAFGVDPGPTAYGVVSGTSMSSPHAAGSAALLRALHPDWSPDEVKSALMASAFTSPPGNNREVHRLFKDDASTPADPFDHGAGRVDLTQAGTVALVLDESAANYEAANPSAGGDPSTLNLASLTDASCPATCAWQRTFTSTAAGAVTWTAEVSAPSGMTLGVAPDSFIIEPGSTQLITVSADVSGLALGSWAFAQVRLVPDTVVPEVRLPVAVVPAEAEDPVPERLTLHFQGNTDEGCTGDGRTDLIACDGPFLLESAELDDDSAARWVASSLANGETDRNIYDPNWVWNLDQATTVSGQMTVRWWGACPGCGLLGDDWYIRLWADGVKVAEERITANPPAPGVAGLLEATIDVPETMAEETFVLHVDPVYIDTQNPSIVYYDSRGSCDGQTEGPCDSLVLMPAGIPLADLQVAGISAARLTRGGEADEGRRYVITATVTNRGDAHAPATITRFVAEGRRGEVFIGEVQTSAIPAGGSVEVSVIWRPRGEGGRFTVTATADGTKLVNEADETNNSSSLEFRVRGD